MSEVVVQAGDASYPVLIGPAALTGLGDYLQRNGNAVSAIFCITAAEIDALWGERLREIVSTTGGWPVHMLFVPAGERYKRLSQIDRLCEEMAMLGADRDSVIVALGGGVIGDMAGFLAAIYMRGIRFIQVPTTLLAQVDSSVGGKTGVNLQAGKNLVGSFHHPAAVFADTAILHTLPARELRTGLMESVKSAIIRDANFFAWLEERVEDVLAGEPDSLAHVVEQSIRIKAAVVAADEREAGLRMILNFGHTLGHAIEAATHYTGLLHGEAIGWGMLAAARLSAKRGILAAAHLDRIERLVRRSCDLPPFTASPEDLVRLTRSDKKKRGSTLSFVLPVAIGQVEIVRDVSEAELQSAAESILGEMLEYRAG